MNENEYYQIPFITEADLFLMSLENRNDVTFDSIEPRNLNKFRQFLKDVTKRYNTNSFAEILELEIHTYPEKWNILFNNKDRAKFNQLVQKLNQLVRLLDSGNV